MVEVRNGIVVGMVGPCLSGPQCMLFVSIMNRIDDAVLIHWPYICPSVLLSVPFFVSPVPWDNEESPVNDVLAMLHGNATLDALDDLRGSLVGNQLTKKLWTLLEHQVCEKSMA